MRYTVQKQLRRDTWRWLIMKDGIEWASIGDELAVYVICYLLNLEDQREQKVA